MFLVHSRGDSMKKDEMRFRAAVAAMSAIIGNPAYGASSHESVVDTAVEHADDLLEALARDEVLTGASAERQIEALT
jgi:hypothetical protein